MDLRAYIMYRTYGLKSKYRIPDIYFSCLFSVLDAQTLGLSSYTGDTWPIGSNTNTETYANFTIPYPNVDISSAAPYSQLPRNTRNPQGSVEGFTCSVCGKKFNNQFVRNRHEKNHQGVKPFRCEFCGYRCSRKDNLKAHIVSCHHVAPTDSSTFFKETL